MPPFSLFPLHQDAEPVTSHCFVCSHPLGTVVLTSPGALHPSLLLDYYFFLTFIVTSMFLLWFFVCLFLFCFFIFKEKGVFWGNQKEL